MKGLRTCQMKDLHPTAEGSMQNRRDENANAGMFSYLGKLKTQQQQQLSSFCLGVQATKRGLPSLRQR